MENLNLTDAFAKFGGKAGSRLHAPSAIAADGAMILSCHAGQFAHPTRGVLRYEDRLSRESDHPASAELLAQHLALARDGELPIRMVVITQVQTAAGKAARNIHVRSDLVGRLTRFDGDHFVVDFVRTRDSRTVRKSAK
jgi:hypothetical protein